LDRLICRYDSEQDSDLMLCERHGVAYQADMRAGRVLYGSEYLAKVQAYEGTPIAKAVNVGRCAMLQRQLAEGASLLDVGAGTGEFVRQAKASGFEAKGYEVIPEAAKALTDARLYADDPFQFDAVTLWDTIEHLEDPQLRLQQVKKGALLFASVPIFEDLRSIRASKHYRPGEHLYYWTRNGFVDWMALHGFRFLEGSDHEIAAGREAIGAFAFKRDLPDYHDHLLAYQEIHASRHYGSSSAELHLDAVAEIVRDLQPASILDYGCGRSDLVAHFWRDGERRIARYDPAIPTFKSMPAGVFDLIFCCDVLEHIPMSGVDRVLGEVRQKGATAVFTISTKLARAKLPDGRNAHVTLLTRSEWIRWVSEVFGKVEPLASNWEHELVLLAGSEAINARRRAAAAKPRIAA
jgi:2-polyprenyl-3-methyl-5-hydroxy-6-metoxy-1,4-benzoquinol methylase